jgi:hypothetical protein
VVIIFDQAALKWQVATISILEKNQELEYLTYTGSYISPRVLGEPTIIYVTTRENKFYMQSKLKLFDNDLA